VPFSLRVLLFKGRFLRAYSLPLPIRPKISLSVCRCTLARRRKWQPSSRAGTLEIHHDEEVMRGRARVCSGEEKSE